MEIGTILQIQISGTNARIKSELIGIEKKKYLIIKMPPVKALGNTLNTFYKGNDIVIRYLYKGTVFGFQTQIVNTIFDPAKLIFVKYPKKFENYELRNNKRIDCYLPAGIKISDNTIEGRITDISREGCQFIVETSKIINSVKILQIEAEIGVCFQLPGVEKEFIITAQQKNIKRDRNNVNIGLWFINMDADVQAKFYGFLSQAEV